MFMNGSISDPSGGGWGRDGVRGPLAVGGGVISIGLQQLTYTDMYCIQLCISMCLAYPPAKKSQENIR
jgi:hypothetical protein